MGYTKPELVPMADARVAIQTTSDGNDGGIHEKEQPVAETGFLNQSTPAYEADE
jgi:hypothetical protein